MATLLYCSFKVPALVVYNEYELGSRYTGKMGLSVWSLTNAVFFNLKHLEVNFFALFKKNLQQMVVFQF